MWKSFKVVIPKDGTKVELGGRGLHGGSTNLRIRNMGTLPVFVGGPNVTPDDGFPVRPGDAPFLFESVGPTSQLFAVSGGPVATDQEIRVLWRDV